MHPSWNIKVTIIEFGGFVTRGTDTESIVIVPEHAAYNAPDSITKFVRAFISGPDVSKNGGDASKAAREVRRIAYDESVGLRVPLGLDSIGVLTSQVEAITKDVEAAGKWSVDLK